MKYYRVTFCIYSIEYLSDPVTEAIADIQINTLGKLSYITKLRKIQVSTTF